MEQTLFVPVTGADFISPEYSKSFTQRRGSEFNFIGRLREGISLENAQSAVTLQASRLEAAYPDVHKGQRAIVYPEPRTRMEPSAAQYMPPRCTDFYDACWACFAGGMCKCCRTLLRTCIWQTKRNRNPAGAGSRKMAYPSSANNGESSAFNHRSDRRNISGSTGYYFCFPISALQLISSWILISLSIRQFSHFHCF